MTTVPMITLNNGVEIPQIGFGVFQIPPEATAAAVTEALGVGYRHIDTAAMYRNEAAVGEAIAHSGIERESVFVTTKLNNNRIGYDAALYGIDRSLDALGFEWVDLYLIHWPLPTVREYVESWHALERIAAEGRARAIGVSNFQPAHLERIITESDTVPAVNQIEVHPYLTQDRLLGVDEGLGIATEAWSPIAQGRVLDDPVITAIAAAHGRTPAQVVLRWHIERGSIVFPKTVSPARMRENFALFDFALTPEEHAEISGCNRDERTGPDPDVFAFVPPEG